MAGERYTLLLVSEKAEKTRQFRLSRGGLRLLILTSFLAVAGGIGTFIYSAAQYRDITHLNSENVKMKAERQEVAELIRDLQRIQEMDTYVRQSLGVPSPREMEDTGVNGPPIIPVSYLENIPSKVPAFGFVTQQFSVKGSGSPEHTGLDVAAVVKTPVHATADGLVVFSGWHHMYGNLVILFHGNDYISLYGHNTQNLVDERKRVKRGDLIALLGETGVTSGPHLHFEIWKDGEPVDPTIFIPEYRSEYMTVRENEKK
ncbi:MAG: peptidoglycan DD-metalloendopeptidase family protein [Candidatus Neomarinimicrobiota bacterium]|nr:peptidoglycan DD-metalloendopeptidase family protein [Candidatus Neomarinimicrobiota bacterium]